jgi:hypothetical protein
MLVGQMLLTKEKLDVIHDVLKVVFILGHILVV